LKNENIAGPLFISIGDEEKLTKFLEVNRQIPRDLAFVDDYSFGVYESMGLQKFDTENAKEVKLEKAPELGGWKGWLDYFKVVGSVSPIPKDMKFGEIPEGVLRLGGTFVVKGNTIIYQYNDKIPGDYPDPQKVLEIAKTA